MADYNIYIHDLSGQNSFISPVKAWQANESSQTKAWVSESASAQDNVGSPNVTTSAAAFKGIGALAKSHPVVMAAIVAVTLADKVTSVWSTLEARKSGDYSFSTFYNNAKATLGVILNPIGSQISYDKAKMENRLYNQAQEQKRFLIGEGLTNYKTRKV